MNPHPIESTLHLGVGIDTARYGHHASFLREDRQPAAPPLPFTESHAGYQQLHDRLRQLHQRHPQAHLHIRIDAAGQYADNLLRFLRGLTLPITLSVGEPKRNHDYHRAVSPKRQADATESLAMARFAVVERPAATPDTPDALRVLRRVAGRLQAQGKQSTRARNQLHKIMADVFPELATLVRDFSRRWLLRLLQQCPTPERLAATPLQSLDIPYLKSGTARALHAAAAQSVGTLRGPIVEDLVRQHVAELERSLEAETALKALLVQAYDAVPHCDHVQLESIQGIGKLTAAALVATMVSIDRFETADRLVGYYGIFPEECSSGVDRDGRPVPPGKKRMCAKGNDLVRGLLWNCTKTAILHNPPVRALYERLVAAGVRGDVALGYCMRKLLHQVFGVWKSGRPFDPNYESAKPAQPGQATAEPTESPATEPTTPESEGTPMAAGRKGQSPNDEAVTATACSVELAAEPVKPGSAAGPSLPLVDFATVRRQVTMEQVLRHLGWMDRLRRGDGPAQYRGPCPVHGEHRAHSRSFSANLTKHAFQCFHPECRAKGNVLDLWAAVHRLPLREAAIDLATRFRLDLTPNCKQRRGTR